MKSGYVSIIGRPNSGKSTLLNKILGEQLSIVTPKAQTTRQKIVGIHNIPGAQIVFLDTPGIHDSIKPLNQYMMEVVEAAVKDSDVVCWVLDIEPARALSMCGSENPSLPSMQDATFAERFAGKILVVFNKLDLVLAKPWERMVEERKKQLGNYECLVVSAKTGYGIDALVSKIVEKLPEGEPFYPDDIYTEHPLRFLVAEIVREQVLTFTHQEIPYSVAVEIEDYKEKNDIHRIYASIILEKDSQKGIVIGAGGGMIKKIGEAARIKIEALTQTRVFLKLFVKVEKNWTKDPNVIRKFFRTYKPISN